MDGLKAVQNLNTRMTQYSLSSVGDAEKQATDLHGEYDGNLKSVELRLEMSKENVSQFKTRLMLSLPKLVEWNLSGRTLSKQGVICNR
jgi:hypothetical protein